MVAVAAVPNPQTDDRIAVPNYSGKIWREYAESLRYQLNDVWDENQALRARLLALQELILTLPLSSDLRQELLELVDVSDVRKSLTPLDRLSSL